MDARSIRAACRRVLAWTTRRCTVSVFGRTPPVAGSRGRAQRARDYPAGDAAPGEQRKRVPAWNGRARSDHCGQLRSVGPWCRGRTK